MEPNTKEYHQAIFAGGCFWCMVSPFKTQAGVIEVISGYTGGTIENPTYEEVCSGKTGHYEAVRIIYDPSKVDYAQLLNLFWQQIDPTDPSGQFADKGPQYQTAIFYNNSEEKKLAEISKARLEASRRFKRLIATKILPAQDFYPAEEYHQDYYCKNPTHYQRYREGSGRSAYLDRTWGNDPAYKEAKEANYHSSPDELRTKLTPIQYRVTQENDTEPPFQNEYWNNHQEGIYVDIVSGEVLFSSRDKFDSGCGWPSFSKAVNTGNIIEKEDLSHGMIRTEVRSQKAGSHLGHVFNDGPTETGLRYCINSAALRFIPVEDLEKEGYGEYSKLFWHEA